jgi:xanthine/CO dehydrogenase XdhC/CoxF family maturation factor
VLVLPRERPLADIEITNDTSVVVMTHNYPLDARLLPEILSRRPRYLGLLGPRQRAERLFEALGRPLGANVYAPAGLDVGGENPAAVALSIISEVQAVAEGRTGAMLRLRDGAIHAPVDQIGNQRLAPSSDIERPAYCETLAGNHAA